MNKGGEIYTIAEWNNIKGLELNGDSFEHWFVNEILAGAPEATNFNVYFVTFNNQQYAPSVGPAGEYNRYLLLA